MTTSILTIAHNEEGNIGACIESLITQTKLPGEIVVVAHNCTDRTEEIIKKYGRKVELVSYKGLRGPLYARIKGFEKVKNEVIACIDADSVAKKDWLEEITRPLYDSRVSATGGYVTFKRSLLGKFMSYEFFYLAPQIKPRHRFYFWGANFACRKKDYERCGGMYPLIRIKKELKMKDCPDDLYLSLCLGKFGRVEFAPMAKVVSAAPRIDIIGWIKKWKNQASDYYKLVNYFGNN